MDISKIIILLLVANVLAVFRFIVFSKFNKLKVMVGLVAVNIAILIVFLFYNNNDLTFSQTDITVLVLIGVAVLFGVFYYIEKRK